MSAEPPADDSSPEGGPRPSPFSSLLKLGSAKVVATLAQLATTVYLTSALGPEPFGLLAMVLALINLLYALRDAGVSDSIVSEPDLTPARSGAAVLILGVLGLVLALVSLAATPLVVLFYGQEDLTLPWIAVCLLTPAHLLSAFPQALAQRAERFGLIGGTQVAGRVLSCLVAVVVASVRPEPDVWPLLALYALPPLVTLLVLGIALRPRLAWPARADLRKTLGFVKGVVGFNLFHVLIVNADDLLIGRFLGKEALGYYDLCFRVMTFPARLLTNLVRSVALPRLSELAERGGAVTPALASSMRSVGILLGPLTVTVSVAAPELIEIAFGSHWMPALRAFQVLALLSLVRSVFSLTGLAFIVSRDTQALARWGAFAAPFLVGSYAIGLPWGILGVAIAQTVVNVALLPVMVRFARRALEESSWTLLTEPLKGIAIGALLALIPCTALWAGRAAGLGEGLRLGLTIGVGAILQGILVLKLRARIVLP